MAAELYNGWYVSANQYEVGPSSGNPSAYQEANAELIYNYLSGLGWSNNAICGMIGNVMYESCIDPACVYPKSSFPNGGSSLADLDNQYAINITNSAYGLVQWLGTTQTPPAGNQLVSYAIRHGYQWYDGEIQMMRMEWEYTNDVKFHPQTVDGVYWTYSMYASSNASVETLAKVWMVCYEGTYSVLSTRQANAVTWFNYFSGTGPLPVGWVSGADFAAYALSYNGQYIPYSQADCITFVNMVWHDIPDVPANIDLGRIGGNYGTNTLWRSTRTFNTTDPNSNNPTNELWYKDTIANCESLYGGIPTGALLFHKISDAGPPAIPPQYAGDGIGNFAHVGIYCGNNEVMQSGGQDASQVIGGGVHLSVYDPNAWNYVAFPVYVDCIYSPEPPQPVTDFPIWLYLWYSNKRKGVVKNVRRKLI